MTVHCFEFRVLVAVGYSFYDHLYHVHQCHVHAPMCIEGFYVAVCDLLVQHRPLVPDFRIV